LPINERRAVSQENREHVPASRVVWRGTGKTHKGLVRSTNQDAFAALDQFNLWIVADGMGGHAGGDVASRTAVETLSSWGPAIAQLDKTGHLNVPPQGKRAKTLRDAIQTANEAIRQQALTQPQLANMGTTLVVVQIAPGLSDDAFASAIIAHVGDSRAYLLRERVLTQLTQDHSWVEEKIKQGVLSPQDALAHPLRSVLTRALGTEAAVEPDLSSYPLQRGDRILLCTDGVTKMLSDGEIAETLLRAGPSAEAACDALIAEANRRGGQDNSTVLLVQAEPL